ncbi:hypothetical protein [Amycolatopsis tolypomycina]|uniref:Ferredoxin-NADP reductase n=1 Tax=Amycolatopsis tolypomycina TaxID=208445 RepID=A0A1H4Z357_9PSEU|nr:hypothetical protein [Amycolatopsis tolypomycina]SED24377.1 hypothetical protein SAMN04489727_7052 [Amycolatopsis tolypomycina]
MTATLPTATESVRARLKRRPWTHHNRLAAAVVAGNVVAATAGPLDVGVLTWLVLGNLTLAVVIRQQLVINLLFRLATAAPLRRSLRLRWTLGKVYHFGGLHVGGTLCATAWFFVLTGVLTARGGPAALLLTSWAIAVVLTGMIVLALPRLRARRHDLFERSHRFGGWSLLVLFTVHSVLLAGPDFVGSGPFWVLLVVVTSVALPWLRLRRVPVRITRPSPHVALLSFDYGVTPFAGSSTALSRNPLLEWHSFANVPAPGRTGFRLTVSRAGDWTGALIDDLPSHLWVKGIPTAGVGNIDKLFRRVVWVATGSGIGPCLPHLLSGETPARLVWSTRHPRRTYGDELVDEILAVQPDAVVWDTDSAGKPDLVELALSAHRDFDAEAVICISNKKTTWHVVEALEARGVPAFGAIWDS